MYGTRARIGLLLPAANHVLEPEFFNMLPEGVSLHIARMLNRNADLKGTAEMNRHIRKAVTELSAIKPTIVAYGCTSGSFVTGENADLEIANRVRSVVKTPVMPTSTAVVTALKELELNRLTVVTPYIDEINKREKSFLEAHSFKVVAMRGLEIRNAFEIGLVESDQVYKFAKDTFREGSDGLLLTCTNLRTLEIVEPLEKTLKIPVISSNQATVWATLGAIGFRSPSGSWGKLFAHEYSNMPCT